ncbi:MAG: RNA polymerase sigma factor [Acidimicrobiales bacterium]
MSDFDAFFEANYAPIVRSLTAAFGNEAAVDEAVQDAFIRAYARWRRVGGYDVPAAWVRRVAINRLHDGRRATDRRERAEQAAWQQSGTDNSVTRSRAGTMVDMIETLAPRQRIAMALYYVEDLSVREIAKSMHISEGAVKAHLSQGRANLAQTTELQVSPPSAEASDA